MKKLGLLGLLFVLVALCAPPASAGVPMPTDSGMAVNPENPLERVMMGKDSDADGDGTLPPAIHVDGPIMMSWGPQWSDHRFVWSPMTMRYENGLGASVELLPPDEFHPGWRSRFYANVGPYWDWDYYMMG